MRLHRSLSRPLIPTSHPNGSESGSALPSSKASRSLSVLLGTDVPDAAQGTVRLLLLRRLRVLSLLGAIGGAAVLLQLYLNETQRRTTQQVDLALMWAGEGLFVLCIMPLFLRSELRLAGLRWLELGVMSAGLMIVYVFDAGWLTAGESLTDATPTELRQTLSQVPWVLFPDGSVRFAAGLQGLAGPPIANFGMLAVLYGVLIPNSWQRCLGFMLFILLCAEACVLHALQTHPALWTHGVTFLSLVFYMVGGFCAAGVYGCHKLAMARQAEERAREVGQYTLEERIGEGGMGSVYRAQHRMLRRPCAVKLIRADQAGSPEMLVRFEREVQAMASLSHPNTVEIYDYGRSEDGTLYYVMEYLPGMNLQQLVRTYGPLSPGRVVYLLRQVCRALSEAHQTQLIHRDIKPGNIFVTQRGGECDIVKLLDFGLVCVQRAAHSAVVTSESANQIAPDSQQTKHRKWPAQATSPHDDNPLTQAGVIVGTPAFMAPEQRIGTDIDARCDLYAVGAVAYYALTAQLPVVPRVDTKGPAPTDATDTNMSVTAQLARLCMSIPEDLIAVMERCLSLQPSGRPAHAHELEAELAQLHCSEHWNAHKAQAWWRTHNPVHTTRPAVNDDLSMANTGALSDGHLSAFRRET